MIEALILKMQLIHSYSFWLSIIADMFVCTLVFAGALMCGVLLKFIFKCIVRRRVDEDLSKAPPGYRVTPADNNPRVYENGNRVTPAETHYGIDENGNKVERNDD
jgi:hypothetical protein